VAAALTDRNVKHHTNDHTNDNTEEIS